MHFPSHIEFGRICILFPVAMTPTEPAVFVNLVCIGVFSVTDAAESLLKLLLGSFLLSLSS